MTVPTNLYADGDNLGTIHSSRISETTWFVKLFGFVSPDREGQQAEFEIVASIGCVSDRARGRLVHVGERLPDGCTTVAIVIDDA